MEDKDRGDERDQLEEHSLPGTNQAGKGPASSEKSGMKNRSGRGASEKHSLPGTNQAGKGPASTRSTDMEDESHQ